MPTFTRDRFTWMGYLMLAYYAYLQASLGPLMPFLRKEMHLNYTVAGLHFSAFALGMVLAGLTGDRIVERTGRRWLYWTGGAGMAVSAVLFALGIVPAMTILMAFSMGFLGTFLLVLIQSTLADHHREQRATALTEANVIASMGSGLAPLLIGGFQQTTLGWRAGLFIGVIVWLGLAAIYYRQPIGRQQRIETKSAIPPTKLPPLFWNYWLVLFLGVSIEWSIVFWGAEFLEKNTGLDRTAAATIMSVYFAAVVLSRAAGSRLTRHFQIGLLLLSAFLMTGAGFFLFWLAPLTGLAVAGLFVAGLGIANLFPLTLSAASSIVEPHQSDTASGRVSLGAGLAILITPQVLGMFADYTSIKTAYGLVAVILFFALAVTIRANQRVRE